MVFVVIDLRHILVDFQALVRWNVCRWLLALVYEFFEERVHLTVEGLSI